MVGSSFSTWDSISTVLAFTLFVAFFSEDFESPRCFLALFFGGCCGTVDFVLWMKEGVDITSLQVDGSTDIENPCFWFCLSLFPFLFFFPFFLCFFLPSFFFFGGTLVGGFGVLSNIFGVLSSLK